MVKAVQCGDLYSAFAALSDSLYVMHGRAHTYKRDHAQQCTGGIRVLEVEAPEV